jgi:glycosyltransferase involved in cell wall biosynthesis
MSPPSRSLRVLMTADAVGGVWVVATGLARKLCRRGAQVTLVTLGPPPNENQIWELNGVEGLEVEITDLALEWMEPRGLDLPRARFRLANLERRVRPHVVHINGFREAAIGWKAPVLVTAHSCVRSWSLACREAEPAEREWQDYAANVRLGLEAAKCWIAPTIAFRDRIQSLYSPRPSGHVIYNGIVGVLPGQEKEPFILAAGRLWDEAKNVAVLSSVASELDWPMRIAGASDFPGAKQIGIPRTTAERIGALYRPHLLEQMQRAGIFAACPVYEPFGLTILEAAASGCALVLSDIPTLRELWSDAALFADPRSPSAFRDALQQACRDAELRKSLQLAALKRARSYSLDRTVEAYGELYHEFAADRLEPQRRQKSCGEAL